MNTRNRIITAAAAIAVCGGGVTGCNNAGEGALSGAALGAGAGAIIGSFTGCAGAGAAIGAATGALAGGVIGDQNQRHEYYNARSYDSYNARPAPGPYCDR